MKIPIKVIKIEVDIFLLLYMKNLNKIKITPKKGIKYNVNKITGKLANILNNKLFLISTTILIIS